MKLATFFFVLPKPNDTKFNHGLQKKQPHENGQLADLTRTVSLLTDGCVWSRCTERTQLTPVSIHNVTKHNRLGGETGSTRLLQIS